MDGWIDNNVLNTNQCEGIGKGNYFQFNIELHEFPSNLYSANIYVCIFQKAFATYECVI